MLKIAIVGAGSIVFCKTLVLDILATPGLEDSEFALMAPSTRRTPHVAAFVERVIEANGLPARVWITTDRREALRDADAVIATFQVGGLQAFEADVAISGSVGSRFSTIVSRFATALINVPVLKDHSLAGLSGGLKNFFGAIHNPNKYHDDHCNPFIADVCMHPWISRKLRLVVMDATYAQYHGGPGKVPRHRWPMGALLVGVDPVAVDSVSWQLLDEQRRVKGLKDLVADGRPPKHVLTAEKRNLGVADRKRIQIVEV